MIQLLDTIRNIMSEMVRKFIRLMASSTSMHI
jgi:hypothetical protein